MNRPLVLGAGLFLVLILIWWQRPHGQTEVSRTALIMGTLVEIRALGSDQSDLESAVSDAFSAMRSEESRFSPHIETSQISRINRESSPVAVDSEVIQVLNLAREVATRSKGAFNIGLGRLVALWDIQAQAPRIPAAEEIVAILPGSERPPYHIDENRVERTSSKVQLDAGGIAKGYAVDRALEVLKREGVESASVNAGGDIGLLGGHGERSWRIGIQHPRRQGELLATLDLRDKAVVTSGDYERFFMYDGERYHHIFDPRTGLPARGCQSVSVIAEKAALADALATAAFVLGPEAGVSLIEEDPQAEGILVAADGKILVSSGLKDSVRWN